MFHQNHFSCMQGHGCGLLGFEPPMMIGEYRAKMILGAARPSPALTQLCEGFAVCWLSIQEVLHQRSVQMQRLRGPSNFTTLLFLINVFFFIYLQYCWNNTFVRNTLTCKGKGKCRFLIKSSRLAHGSFDPFNLTSRTSQCRIGSDSG